MFHKLDVTVIWSISICIVKIYTHTHIYDSFFLYLWFFCLMVECIFYVVVLCQDVSFGVFFFSLILQLCPSMNWDLVKKSEGICSHFLDVGLSYPSESSVSYGFFSKNIILLFSKVFFGFIVHFLYFLI